MDTATAHELEFSSWSASGHALVIEYSRRVLDEIRAETVEGLNRLRHGGIEVGGILFGVHEGDRVQVLDWRAIPCEYANGPSFHLTESDAVALETLIADAKADAELSGLEPVGWYHSHTRSGVFLSESDIALYDRHFPKPWQIALVLRPSSMGPAEAGFFFREADGTLRADSSHSLFMLDPLPKQPLPARMEARMLDPVGDRSFEAPPMPVSSQTQRVHRRRWLIPAVALAGLAIAVLAVISTLLPGRPRLNLRAADRDGHVRIEWDRSDTAVRSAETASVLIVDGDQRVETALSPELLHNGSLVYQRKSPDVEIRMLVNAAKADSVQEVTRLIGLPVPPAVSVERLESADRPPPPIETPRPQKTRRTEKASLPEPEFVAYRESAPPLPQPTPSARMAPPVVAAPPRIPIPTPTPTPARPSLQPGPAYRGPMSGRLIWTGTLAGGKTLKIDGDHVSTGDLTGTFPKTPIKVNVYPASFSREGLDIFARELPGSKALNEAPGPANGWTRTIYKRNPKRAGDVVVSESPSAHNNWKRIGLSAGDHTVSVIVIDWQALPLP